MIKEVINLWTEYKEWIASENKPIYDKYSKLNKEQWKQFKIDTKLHDAREKEVDKQYEKERELKAKAISDYDSLSWFKQLFVESPYEEFINTIARRRYYSPGPSLPFILPVYGLKKATQEGFMDWLEERQNGK